MNENNIKSKILIVDDYPENLSALGLTLEMYGYEVSIHQDGASAIQMVISFKPDLILLDIMMGNISGYDVCCELQKIPETKDIPIIFITAKKDVEDLVHGFEIGGMDYITKPFTLAEVIARVKTQLELKFSRDKNIELIIKLKEANDRYKEISTQLSDLNMRKDKFFSIIAHDLINPFQGFIGLTELILTDIQNFSQDDIIEMADEMNKAAVNIYELLENLLIWSRIQLGTISFNPIKLNVSSVVSEKIKQINDSPNKKDIEINNSLPDKILAVADINMLNNIFQNILSNALKYTFSNGGIISVSLTNDKNYNIINIQDNGTGMTKEELSKLFRLDVQFKKPGNNNETGNGLGLIICKELIEKIKGKITLESECNIGTSVKLYLPIINV